MAQLDAAPWSDRLRLVLARYDEALLRRVATRLVKPRGSWPVEEVRDKCVAAAANAALIDRRLAERSASERQLLAAIALSGQPRWQFGDLVWIAVALGDADPLPPLRALLDSGLLYPDLVEQNQASITDFDLWLGQGGLRASPVFAHPAIAARCVQDALQIPACPPAAAHPTSVLEADGLEWPLRLVAFWQLLQEAPLRRTQQGEFFKRDQERLTGDVRLNGPAAEGLVELPDAAILVARLAQLLGLTETVEVEVRARPLPAEWQEELAGLLGSLWAALPLVEGWNPHRGGSGGATATGNPYPSAYLLTFLQLARLPEEAWAAPEALEAWVIERHPYWPGRKPQEVGLRTFLLGVAYPLRLLQAGKDADGNWLVRLSPLGRALLGLAPAPLPPPPFSQTLLVQPNLEIIAYRQGLTPALMCRLSQFARWISLGSACTLQLQPEVVYRALEAGLTFETIVQTLEQHGMRALPNAVVEALRTWASKRDRITVHAGATLFEFGSAEDLQEALARGLPGVKLSDRLVLVSDEAGIDFRHFRLTGTRDYGLPPEKCVEVGADGVTLSVDVARSDLFLDSELRRFADPVDVVAANGRRRFRVTPATLARGRAGGMTLKALEDWFDRRTGQDLSPACRFLLNAAEQQSPRLRTRLVLELPSPEFADGLCQWPETAALIEQRLGPATLAVAEDQVPALAAKLSFLGVVLER